MILSRFVALSVSLIQKASPFQPGRHYTYPTLDVFGGTHNILWSGALPSQVAHDFVTGWAKTGGAFTMEAEHKPGAFAGFCPFTQFGHGYGLLALDLVEQFQIFAFFMLGQAQTPGTWTAAECLGLDRTGPSGALRPTGGGMGSGYVAPSQALMPTLVKWLCQFEDYSGVLWLGKALPREWLAPGAPAVRLERSPSSLGRLCFTVQATDATTVTANLTLPKLVDGAHHASVAGGGFAWPEAGIKLRLRSALFPAKKITSVTVTRMRHHLSVFVLFQTFSGNRAGRWAAKRGRTSMRRRRRSRLRRRRRAWMRCRAWSRRSRDDRECQGMLGFRSRKMHYVDCVLRVTLECQRMLKIHSRRVLTMATT